MVIEHKAADHWTTISRKFTPPIKREGLDFSFPVFDATNSRGVELIWKQSTRTSRYYKYIHMYQNEVVILKVQLLLDNSYKTNKKYDVLITCDEDAQPSSRAVMNVLSQSVDQELSFISHGLLALQIKIGEQNNSNEDLYEFSIKLNPLEKRSESPFEKSSVCDPA